MSLGHSDLLKLLGWSEFFEQQEIETRSSDWVPARVIGEERGLFRLQSAHGIYWGEITGSLRHEAEGRLRLPATGDWVACTPLQGSDRAVIHEVYERRSCLVRKVAGKTSEPQILAANADTVFITTSVGEDLNPRRIERYLAMAWEGGATPVVLLTKSDLVDDITSALAAISNIAGIAEVLAVSTRTGAGLEALARYFEGNHTCVFLGSSGVGKSTLVNHLIGKEVLKTQAVREGDQKGRHTTTARHLFQLPGGGMIIDTPGMRELGLLDHETGVGTLFADIEELANQCKFSNCEHATEPGCAVKAAIASGALDSDRMEAYRKLERELIFERNKTDKAFASETRKKWKQASKSMKTFKKLIR